MTRPQIITIVAILMFNLPVALMLWIGGAIYGDKQHIVWISLMLAQVLGAIQVPLFVQMWRRG